MALIIGEWRIVMEPFLDWFASNEDWVYRTFETLHGMPERGFQEVMTSAFLSDTLRGLGWEVRNGFAGTAVLGVKRGREAGPCVCLRADMDALTFTIDGAAVCIHACGHDANMTEVLSVAAAAAAADFPRKGTLMVLFQPCEEEMRGALSVIKSGVLRDVDYLIGTHLRPAAELANGACPAIIHGAMQVARVLVHGRAAHGARPHAGVNAVAIGAEIVHRAAQIARTDDTPFSVKATRFSTAPGSVNVIPAEAELWFDLRGQTNACMADICSSLETLALETAAKCNAKAEILYEGGVPAAEVSDEALAAAGEAISDTFGKSGLHAPVVTAGGEDFHFYTRELPNIKATVLGFGADMKCGLHDPDMTFDHRVLPLAARCLAKTAEICIYKSKSSERK